MFKFKQKLTFANMSHQKEWPIRDEIFSPERLEEYAAYLARELSVSYDNKSGRSLLPRLKDNHECLNEAYDTLLDSLQNDTRIAPAGEWIIDNYHIIQDQVREVIEDLPDKYYQKLPKVNSATLRGLPRVYAIALAIIAHQDSHIDIETLKRFVIRFQTVTPLKIGEIWAIAIALRIGLVENLRRIAAQVIRSQKIREWADDFADRTLHLEELSQAQLARLIEEIEAKSEILEEGVPTFAVHLLGRLREQSECMLPICEFLVEHLSAQDLTIDEALHQEYQAQAQEQVSVGNIITSMRLISNVDWADFFESVNLIDPILTNDPAQTYHLMDFSSRDRYRHVIERLHYKTGISELEIASKVLDLCLDSAKNSEVDPRNCHVGYYLVGSGIKEIERRLCYRRGPREYLKSILINHPTSIYLGLLFLSTLGLMSLILVIFDTNATSWWFLTLMALISLIPISDTCLNLINFLITKLLPPRILPKVDVSKMDASRVPNVLVIVPTIFSTKSSISKILDGLEIRYLSNQDKNLYFALLSDFTDSDYSSLPGDDELVNFVKHGIEELNQRYGATQEKFFLFHRKRLWNPAQGKWMGYERKRGKIHEFNRFLRGSKDTSFICHPQFSSFFSEIKYVITLDTDTHLPRGSATKLLGTILHPLNTPFFDTALGRVTSGHAILQPRIGITPECSDHSLFSFIFSGHTGIDPYTTASSDVYQDLFEEGIYTGKGLYVVDEFERSLESNVPENALLSHDLFEGLFARAALVTDIELLDDYPSHYESFAKRQHRWTRGDWQLLPWLLSSKLPLISRWKIFDNLRRSLVAPATFAWLVMAWALSPESAGIWSFVILLVISFPPSVRATNNLLIHQRDLPWMGHILGVFEEFKISILQVSFSLLCLPHQAYLQVDAIIRTLKRVFISKRNLLDWVCAAEAESKIKKDGALSTHFFWSSLSLPIGVAIIVLVFQGFTHFLFLSPILLAWCSFPAAIKYLCKSRKKSPEKYSEQQSHTLRMIARKTWNYFDCFSNEEENWLIPDNYQVDPTPLVAHRTSPTNIGLLLMSTCSAHNMGHIGVSELLSRTKNTLDTMMKLERNCGHFYNWYDTRSLSVLSPQYISTVDSGNLAGHLICVKQSLLEIESSSAYTSQTWSSLTDGFNIIKEKVDLLSIQLAKKKMLQGITRDCILLINDHTASSISDYKEALKVLRKKTELILSTCTSCQEEADTALLGQLYGWCHKMIDNIGLSLAEINLLVPWERKELEECIQLLDNVKRERGEYLKGLLLSLERMDSFNQWRLRCLSILAEFARDSKLNFLGALISKVESSLAQCEKILELSRVEASRCQSLVDAMDFSVLFDKERKIFTIGFNASEGIRDNSFYDLLASESRLASFIAIAKGDVPQSHWFHLGRQMTVLFHKKVLVSWSASMFEYLMPLLVMRDSSESLLGATYRSVVDQQISYGEKLNIPWGVSESGYNARDLQLNYQYGPFGVPGMGLKRGLADDIVVSPYSSVLAAMVAPFKALDNLQRFIREDLLTDWGFYEAIDYTKERLKVDSAYAIVKNFMAHHQGMTLVAIDNVLNHNIMQSRFHRDLLVKSCDLLLEERLPRGVPFYRPRTEKYHIDQLDQVDSTSSLREVREVDCRYPETQVLSNGKFGLMISAQGSGFSKSEDLALTRWYSDSTREFGGIFFYLKDSSSKKSWSPTFLPLAESASSYRTTFSEHKAEFWCHKEEVRTHLEVIVSTEDNVELRRFTMTNTSKQTRELTLTSYLEPILTSHAADLAHPAFSNLFIETEYIESKHALLAHRRKRSSSDQEVWAVHLVTSNASEIKPVQYETSRRSFIGRGHTLQNPAAIREDVPLGGHVGAVLDPAFALRKSISLKSTETVQLCYVSGLASSREEALRVIDQYHDLHAFNREDEMAWTKSQAQLRHLRITHEDAGLYQQLATGLIFPVAPLRAPAEIISKNQKPQSGLWAYGVSGDLPILLLMIESVYEMPLLKQLLHAHEYLRLKMIKFDLIVINTESSTYRQDLQNEMVHQVRLSGQQGLINKRGGIYLFRKDALTTQDLLLFQAVSSFYIESGFFELKDYIKYKFKKLRLKNVHSVFDTPPRVVKQKKWRTPDKDLLFSSKLDFYNGMGGFASDGREYVINKTAGSDTPSPWINVIANESDFGFLVTERGSSCTWYGNSRENRLTPWSNDPISDPSGEVIYCYEKQRDLLWTPTPAPLGRDNNFVIKHTQGHSVFKSECYEIEQELTVFALKSDRAKVSALRLKNTSDQKRELRLIYYVEWVLGLHRSKTAPHIVSCRPKNFEGLIAQNPYDQDFGRCLAFVATNEKLQTFTSNRKKIFESTHGSENPNGVRGQSLGEECGPGLDPCAALVVEVELLPGEEREILFMLGQDESIEQIEKVVSRVFSEPKGAAQLLTEVNDSWNNILDVLQIKTPYPEFDFLVNRWALYQNLSCRIWARTAFYQSGGAYGFRDQLQDVMALLYTSPQIARAHILKAAAHQFVEGDVLHWWHPPSGKGVRTHFSDDLLWLPYVVSIYLATTKDDSLLAEEVSYIEGAQLPIEKEDMYFEPTVSYRKESLYHHCLMAIERSLKVGDHNLPLMGTGDWNDGMSHVGAGGKGESVWLGWFLCTILEAFIPICEKHGDGELAQKFKNHIAKLLEAIESLGWDGKWYRRAFFDDGTPLGSAQNDECKIDSLTQSWASISQMADREHVKLALAAVNEYLVKDEEQMVLLFTPPFDQTNLNPGYIKGYVPGVRENGGQYTHAAIWCAMGFAANGQGDRAFEIMSLINPINHSLDEKSRNLYQVEPYVIAADVYATKNGLGQGGWSWYTGSCGWFYRAFVTSILGFSLEGDSIRLAPTPTKYLGNYQLDYRFQDSTYYIKVICEVEGDASLEGDVEMVVTLDGESLDSNIIPLRGDKDQYLVEARISYRAK